MASGDRGGIPSLRDDGLISDPDRLSTSDSESGSSFISSGAPSQPAASICQWRTEQYHDEECERFFDCPTHIVERALSERGERDNNNNGEGPSIQLANNAQERISVTGQNPLDDPRSESDRTSLESSNDEPQAHISSTQSRGDSHTSDEDASSAGAADADSEEDRIPSRPPSRSSVQPIIDGVHASRSSDAAISTANETGGSAPSPSTSRVSNNETTSSGFPVYRTPPPALTNTRPANPNVGTGPRRPETQWNIMAGIPTGLRVDPAGRRANQERPQAPRAPIIPRWQPDNEVTYCPICRTQFSIFVRKHHCRKCGRVVCNSCSPHRIVIPYQFIVQPPGYPRASQRYPSPFISSEGGYSDFNSLGGGERVRLCNPCVPDPNTTPHQAYSQGQTGLYPPHSPQGHIRSQSSSNTPYTYQSAPGPVPHPSRVPPIFSSRNRSVTMASQQPTTGYRRPPESRILSGTPPAPRSDYLTMGSASSPAVAGPSTARYEIPEEDECPVCHRELPPRSLPNFEAQREAHITICIQTHSQYGPGSPSAASPGDAAVAEGNSTGTRRATTGMFPYTATEKDCVDSAECTICLEEFEVGVSMARLECLCRFHKACILAWWESHPGRCPVHQHDGYGF